MDNSGPKLVMSVDMYRLLVRARRLQEHRAPVAGWPRYFMSCISYYIFWNIPRLYMYLLALCRLLLDDKDVGTCEPWCRVETTSPRNAVIMSF